MSLAAKKKKQAELAEECFSIQEEYKGQPMPEKIASEFAEKCDEAEKLQKEIEEVEERESRVVKLREYRDRVTDPGSPPAEPDEGKTSGEIAGYITLGDAVVMSDAYQKFVEAGTPKGHFELFRPKPMVRQKGADELFVPLDVEERKAVEQAMEEVKAVPTIGSGVIEPQRLAVVPQVTADDRLVLRDVLSVGRTNSNSVDYVREESFTRAAAETAHGAAKPEATVDYTEQSSTVRTLAVWMPAQVQQLSDWPQLRSLIDGRLRYDIEKREEEQIMYGDGVAPNLEGILNVSGTTDVSALSRYAAGDPATDKIRMAMTEVRTAGYDPNALVIHPIDWEAIVLLKGTDDHYLRQVFPDTDGNMRVWGLQVVETVAAEENAGNTTEERNWVVGDFRRGVQLLVREDIGVAVGMQNDDFTKNLRTILAEERVALPIYAPAAFAYLETVTAVA